MLLTIAGPRTSSPSNHKSDVFSQSLFSFYKVVSSSDDKKVVSHEQSSTDSDARQILGHVIADAPESN